MELEAIHPEDVSVHVPADYVTINGKQVPRSYINRLVAEADGTAPATTTTERRLRSARRNKSRRSLTQADDPYYTDNYYSYYYYESIYDFYSPTGTGTFDPSYDPQAYDKPGDATVDDLTPGMMDDIIMHGPAMACAPSYRHMFLDSMMNTDALANLARVTIIQGPLYYTFSVRSASAVPRCALQASANYDSHPCEIYDQLLPSDMVVTIGLEGVGTIMLDRTKVTPLRTYAVDTPRRPEGGASFPPNPFWKAPSTHGGEIRLPGPAPPPSDRCRADHLPLVRLVRHVGPPAARVQGHGRHDRGRNH